MLREVDAKGNAGRLDLDRDVLPVAVVIEEERTVVVGIEEPVLDVDASIGPRVDVHVGDPVPRVGASRADLGRKTPAVGIEVADAANPREQPTDRRRAVCLLGIEDDGRRKAGGQGGLQRVGKPVLIRVVEGQGPRPSDRRGGGPARGTVPAADAVHQGEEKEPTNDDESQGPGGAVNVVSPGVLQVAGSISGTGLQYPGYPAIRGIPGG